MVLNPSYTLADLVEKTGVAVRVIRFYIASELVNRPNGYGSRASYDDQHLYQLLITKALVEQRVPHRDIKVALQGLDTPALRKLWEKVEARSAKEESLKTTSTKDYAASLLFRKMDLERDTSLGDQMSLWNNRDSLSYENTALPKGSQTLIQVPLLEGVNLQFTAKAFTKHQELIENLLNLARKK